MSVDMIMFLQKRPKDNDSRVLGIMSVDMIIVFFFLQKLILKIITVDVIIVTLNSCPREILVCIKTVSTLVDIIVAL